MKKIILSAFVAFAAFFAVSCEQEHLDAIYDPANSTAAVISGIQGCELDEAGSAITATFDLSDMGEGFATVYSLYMSTNADMADAQKVNADISIDTEAKTGTISISQKNLNVALLNMGAAADEEFTVYFQLVSCLMNDKGAAIDKTALASNILASSFIPYNADVLDKDKYDVYYMPGDYQSKGSTKKSWHFEDEQYLYEYESGTYSGLVDFYEAGAGAKGFKFTPEGNWDADLGYPGDNVQAEDQAKEPATLELAAKPGADNTDLKCFTDHRYYFFSLDANTKVLTKKFAFSTLRLVGTINSWNVADDNLLLTYNKFYHRFYIDYTFAAGDEIKFTCDGGWDLNWGANMEQGGDNIAAPSGSYRLYIDFNKNEYEFNDKMFGQEEPGETGGGSGGGDEPVAYKGWGITGSIASASINWDGDVAMTEKDGVWTGYVTLAVEDAFKFRKDALWEENYGAAGEEDYTIENGRSFEAVAGGANMKVPESGFYALVLNTNEPATITVTKADVWGVIGEFNSWAGDSFMTNVDGKWVSDAIALEANKGFKIRYNAGWDVNRGAAEGDAEPVVVELGKATAASQGGKNMAVAQDGEYIITYDPEAETITVNPSLPQNCWSLIGQIGGSSWDKDFYMTEKEGVWMSDKFAIKAGDQFKVRFNNDWGVNRGDNGDTEPKAIGYGDASNVANNGKNLTVKEDGEYVVVYDSNKELVYLLGWGVVGQINGMSWDGDVAMAPSEGGIWTSAPFTVEGGFKIRFNADWAANRGGVDVDVLTPGSPLPVEQNGKNLVIENPSGKYVMVYDANAETITVNSVE